MKDIGFPIRAGYVALLDGLTVAGKEVKVFDMIAPFPEKTPYIIIDSIMQVADNTRDTFMSEVTVDFKIYTSYNGDFGGRKLADQISNAVLELAIPTPGKAAVTADGFNVYRAKLLPTQDEFSSSDVKRTYLKRLVIEHLTEEL